MVATIFGVAKTMTKKVWTVNPSFDLSMVPSE